MDHFEKAMKRLDHDLIQWIERRIAYWGGWSPTMREPLFEAAVNCLARCDRDFDEKRDTDFQVYYRVALDRELQRSAGKLASEQIRERRALEIASLVGSWPPVDAGQAPLRRERVAAQVARCARIVLDEAEFDGAGLEVLRLRFGIGGDPPLALPDIASRLGLSLSEAVELEEQALAQAWRHLVRRRDDR